MIGGAREGSRVDEAELSAKARRLAAVIEPFAGQVYFSPECHGEYVGLGFSPSPEQVNGVALPDGPAYFCSRGSVLGQVPGELVASAFAVFSPSAVVPAVTFGWSITDAATIERARTEGAIAQLTRILGPAPEGVERVRDVLDRASGSQRVAGKPLYAGVLAQEVPSSPLGAAWRYADRLREYRGDAHTAAWTSAGFDAVEIGLLTELYWGLPLKTYIRSRGWSEAELDDGIRRLEYRGLLRDGSFTQRGREEREAVELNTDGQCRPVIESLGDDFDEVISLLRPIGKAIRAQRGYPPSGPHDMAGLYARRGM
jgi:helix-turn-helix protein